LQYGAQSSAPPPLHQQESDYSQQSAHHVNTVPHTDVPLQQAYQAPLPDQQHRSEAMEQGDFLQRIEGTKQRINQLTADISSISNIHQRMLASPDNRSSSELESIITQTQIRNTQIKDEIKFLEKDASRPHKNAAAKRSQVESLKRSFKSQLELFQKEEAGYRERYREAIGRQYRIVNPDATDAEVQEATSADWGEEGVFTQAVSTHADVSSSMDVC
jgi:syntaxin 1B/2/3